MKLSEGVTGKFAVEIAWSRERNNKKHKVLQCSSMYILYVNMFIQCMNKVHTSNVQINLFMYMF